jgi:Amino acid transporters
MVFLAPRVSQVMGEDTYILRPLSRRSKKGTPYVAIWVQFTISSLLIITNSFALITKYTGITLSFFALLAVIGVFVHRKRFPEMKRPYKTWGYPITPVIFIVLISWSIIYLIYEDYKHTFDGSQNVMWMSIISVSTLVSGAGIYLLNKVVVKYKKKNL